MRFVAEEPVDHLPLLTDSVPPLSAQRQTDAAGEGEGEGYDPYNNAPTGAQQGNR